MKFQRLLLVFTAISILLSFPFISYAGQNEKNKEQLTDYINWEGEYIYVESGGKNTGMFIDYSIKIYREDDVLVAKIDADGFQTEMRLTCSTKIIGNKIYFYFKEYRKDNLFALYKPGELLLSLEKRRRKILTNWAAIEPQLNNFKNGRVYFEKQ